MEVRGLGGGLEVVEDLGGSLEVMGGLGLVGLGVAVGGLTLVVASSEALVGGLGVVGRPEVMEADE